MADHPKVKGIEEALAQIERAFNPNAAGIEGQVARVMRATMPAYIRALHEERAILHAGGAPDGDPALGGVLIDGEAMHSFLRVMIHPIANMVANVIMSAVPECKSTPACASCTTNKLMVARDCMTMIGETLLEMIALQAGSSSDKASLVEEFVSPARFH
jgi:hypothetical protein